MVTLKIKGTACCLYSVYTVVTTSHSIDTQHGSYIYHSWAVIPLEGILQNLDRGLWTGPDHGLDCGLKP